MNEYDNFMDITKTKIEIVYDRRAKYFPKNEKTKNIYKIRMSTLKKYAYAFKLLAGIV
jgi:hypothetical protein